MFRMAGTFPLTAQSPRLIRNLQCLRNSWPFRRSSSVLTDPSMIPTSTDSGNLLGVDQRAVDDVDLLGQLDQRSSISRKDMWQPEQPSSQVVATVIFLSFAHCVPLIRDR